jgi:8-oxo-dGTP pyrophosphatase MutT (NUDIX family)
VIREFSAGGVVLRAFRRKPFLAAIRTKSGRVLALPKGHIEPGESAMEAARREVREETGLEAEALGKLDDVSYWYSRDGERVFKNVAFYLFSYRSGSLDDHDEEVDSAEWVPLEEAPERLSYRGERDVAALAVPRAGEVL